MYHMKRIAYLFSVVLVITSISGCKKFLNVDPPSDLSGNNFWQTLQDVENFTNGNYELFRQSVTRTNMQAGSGNDEFPFYPFGADMRGGMMIDNTNGFREYVRELSNNNIRSVLYGTGGLRRYWGDEIFNLKRFTQWDRFYRVIAAANIAVDRISTVPDPALTPALKNAYLGEAVFIRNLAYFHMVRLYGDVAYYTEPYFSKPLKRLPMVQVLKNCIADMKAYYKGMVWTYDDPFYVGIRGMRGSAIVMMMEMNMWLAGFDRPNSATYYNDAIALGDEIRNENGGAYDLLPLEDYVQIFKGRSKENLFGVPQNRNYGETFGWSDFFDQVKYDLVLRGSSGSIPYTSYNPDFMRALYPEGAPDKRASLWFDPVTLYNANRSFAMKKFLVTTDPNSLDANNRNDATQTIYRYVDVFLLQAEAYAELGNEGAAKQALKIVRDRAAAPEIVVAGEDLKEQIFLERARELLGEGHYWYDCVRTRRITDVSYKFCYHTTVEEFQRGAWTWPIDRSALANNPEMTLNNYWE